MNEVIRQIQATRDNCVSELWNPSVTNHPAPAATATCYSTNTLPKYKSPLETKIGDLTVPRSLYDGFVVDTNKIRGSSGRDSDNNILVYWNNGAATRVGVSPADASECWLYVSRLNVWDQSY